MLPCGRCAKIRSCAGSTARIFFSRAYQGTGFGAWKSGGSVQERLVERQEERERRLAASSTKHLAELLGLDAKELYGFFNDAKQ